MSGTLNLGRVVGENGKGVPTGGSTGAILRKRSGSNYDTEWAAFKPVLVIDMGIIAALPDTATNANIKADMVVVGYEFSKPEVFDGDITVTTAAGSLTVSGEMRDASRIKIILASAS